MSLLWQKISGVWQSKLGFKVSASYLLLLLAIVLLLPWLPLPFAPNHLDLDYTSVKPFSERAWASGHILGTDTLGRDLASNLLYGARTAFFIAFPVISLATLLGTALGVVAGFYHHQGAKLLRYQALFYLLAGIAFLYYSVYVPAKSIKLGLGTSPAGYALLTFFSLVIVLWIVCRFLLAKVTCFRRVWVLPADAVIMRFVESLSTVPRFVLILVLAAFLPPSVPLLSLLLIFTMWPASARLARAEMLRIKQLSYFEAALSIGSPTIRLLWHHAFPNLIGPVLIAYIFGLGGLLTLESTLSFLNIGVPGTLVSWGRTISSIRTNTAAWWLVVLPGSLLSITVLALYTCGHYLSKILTAKA
ncbi:ABC transporter permease [Pontibacter oryzae]|uniref:ABC transporter permease n=1 Tax=Pontibacter oryzae TaxID=2304593 RepID=A0A399SI73_9BACT|nr:ABC transporter permease [Pontibacter oryzae]RIJ41405.1 ABC transporter permease [Pontibacter oryzae]